MNDQHRQLIASAARMLANAEDFLDDERAVEEAALAEVREIEERIKAVDERIAEVRRQVQAGALTDVAAGGAYALAQADRTDLEAILADASGAFKAAAEKRQSADMRVAHARQNLTQIEGQIRFEALERHAAELDAALCKAVGELFRQGTRALGKPQQLSASWRPSMALNSAIINGVAPK